MVRQLIPAAEKVTFRKLPVDKQQNPAKTIKQNAAMYRSPLESICQLKYECESCQDIQSTAHLSQDWAEEMTQNLSSLGKTNSLNTTSTS